MTTEQPTSSDLAAQIAAAFILAEQQLLAGATRMLTRTAASTVGQLEAIAQIRALAGRIARALAGQTPAVRAMVAAATVEGRRTASSQVSKALELVNGAGSGSGHPPIPGRGVALPDEPFDLSMTHAERSALAIARDLESSLEDVRRRITRLPDDIYKAIAPHGAIYQVHDNNFTPAQAQAAAWRVFTSQGVRGFTDRSGRDWSLSAYVEMAVRTASARAYNASHLARMTALGIEYFTVSDTGHPCPLCYPWQGKVLTDGPVADPVMPVDATIEQATAAGLFHPACRHVLTAILPGITVLPPAAPWTPEMQAAYDNTQRQRRIELEIRKAKKAAEYALTPEARANAIADVRSLQARMRQFINDTGLLRQSRREQVDLRDQTIKLPTPIR